MIIHRRAVAAEFFRELDEELRHAVDEVVYRAVSAGKLLKMFAAEEGLVADIETDHGERPAGLKNDLGRFGIVIDIRFRGSVNVSAFDGAAHEDDFLDEWDDGGIFLDRERDVGKGADGDQGYFVRRGVDELDD